MAMAAGTCLPAKGPELTACRYELLLDCYVVAMRSKGVTLASPPTLVAKHDPFARRSCAREVADYRKFVGQPALEKAWKGLWSDNASRD